MSKVVSPIRVGFSVLAALTLGTFATSEAQAQSLVEKAICKINGMNVNLLQNFIKAKKITAEDIKRDAPAAFKKCYVSRRSDVFKVLWPYLKDLKEIPVTSRGTLYRGNGTTVSYPGGTGVTVYLALDIDVAHLKALELFSQNPAQTLSSISPEAATRTTCLGRSLINSAFNSRKPELIDIAIKRGLITKDTRFVSSDTLTGWKQPGAIFEEFVEIKQKRRPRYSVASYAAYATTDRLSPCPWEKMKRDGRYATSPVQLLVRDIGKRNDLSLARFIKPLCAMGQRTSADSLHNIVRALRTKQDLKLIDMLIACGAKINSSFHQNYSLTHSVSYQSVLARVLKLGTHHSMRKDTLVNYLIARGALP